MSPEQGLHKEVDHRIDIYSLGIVFFEMITGRAPFEADTPFSVMMKHVTEPVPRPRDFVPDLPEEVEDVLFKALAKDPDERYQSMGEFGEALESLWRIQEKHIVAKESERAISIENELTRETLDQTTSPKNVEDAAPKKVPATKKFNFKLWGVVGAIVVVVATIVISSLIIGENNRLMGSLNQTKTPEPIETTPTTLVSTATQKPTTSTEIASPTDPLTLQPTITTEPSTTLTPIAMPEVLPAFITDTYGVPMALIPAGVLRNGNRS